MPDAAAKRLTLNLALFERMHAGLHKHLIDALNALPDHDGQPVQSKRFRFQINPPAPDDVDRQTFDFVDTLLSRCAGENVPLFEKSRSEESYFLLLAGAPDEAALEDALNRFQPKCLLIGVGDINAFARSLSRVDWARHMMRVQDTGGTVYLLADADLNAIIESAWRTCRKHNPTRIDGFGVLASGDPDYQRRAAILLTQTLMLSVTLLGFIHDETLMLWNNYRNFTMDGVRKFRKRPASATEVPVFIVASGPSLDADIAFITTHADRAIIVSLATSLRPLLKAGIRPDYHVELENTDVTPKVRQLADEFDLSGIRLVASTSVETEALTYFSGAVLYARYALSSYPIFSGGTEETLRLPGPTAGNAALCFALESGFRNIYLFGLDFGTVDPNKHHSDASYYYTEGADAYADTYDIPIDGNFRETVYTSRAFLSALKNATDLVGMFRGRAMVFNCSDGARIGFTHSQPSTDIQVASDVAAKMAALEHLEDHFAQSGTETVTWPGADLAAAITTFAATLKGAVSDPTALSDGRFDQAFIDACDLVSGYQDAPPLGAEASARMLMRGTLLSMMLFANRYRARVANADDVAAYDAILADVLTESMDALVAYAIDLLGGPAPKAPPPIAERTAEADRTLPEPARIPRNASCPCGSGKKFKQCHGKPV